jgi:hypothetical protein
MAALTSPAVMVADTNAVGRVREPAIFIAAPTGPLRIQSGSRRVTPGAVPTVGHKGPTSRAPPPRPPKGRAACAGRLLGAVLTPFHEFAGQVLCRPPEDLSPSYSWPLRPMHMRCLAKTPLRWRPSSDPTARASSPARRGLMRSSLPGQCRGPRSPPGGRAAFVPGGSMGRTRTDPLFPAPRTRCWGRTGGPGSPSSGVG